MRIDFKNTDEQIIDSFKGGEKFFAVKMYDDDEGKIMRGRLVPGASIGMHTHIGNSETVYIISGSGKVIYDGEDIPLTEGDCHHCPEGHAHSLVNCGSEDLIFFAVVR
jgi:mannose-6-phosphate isomerase-like protein (cupin superfamily)